jgi:uncharacterized tellurite resistance protein B-like protein
MGTSVESNRLVPTSTTLRPSGAEGFRIMSYVFKSPGELFYVETYGTTVGELPMEYMVKFARAVCKIAGADGVLSAAEWSYFANFCKLYGWSDADLQAIKDFDYRSASLKDFTAGWPPVINIGRVILYIAIKTASQDGYAAQESAAVTEAAGHLGVDAKTVAQLESLVALEANTRELKRQLLDLPPLPTA